jgi:hypothetical protein
MFSAGGIATPADVALMMQVTIEFYNPFLFYFELLSWEWTAFL